MHVAVYAVELGFDDVHIPNQVLVIDFFHDPVVFIPSSLLMHGKEHAVVFTCRNHFVIFRNAHGSRFLTDHMLFRCRRLLHHLRMAGVRRGYHHDIDIRVGKHLVNVCVCLHALRRVFELIRIRIRYRYQVDLVKCTHHIRIAVAHKTKSNDT